MINHLQKLLYEIVINYEPSFADDSWSEIAANVKNNQAAYKVGDTKQVLIGNKPYTVRIANKSTPTECNDSDFSQTACGFVVEFVDIVEKRLMNPAGTYNGTEYPYGTNLGGWPATAMRTYLNGEFLAKLPSDLQSVIADTTVVSGYGYDDSSNFTSTDKLYLLSTKEVWDYDSDLSVFDTATGSTRQLEYYANNNVTTSNYSGAIKKYAGSAAVWWLRTADSNTSNIFLDVYSSGYWSGNLAVNSYGLAPAFRIG